MYTIAHYSYSTWDTLVICGTFMKKTMKNHGGFHIFSYFSSPPLLAMSESDTTSSWSLSEKGRKTKLATEKGKNTEVKKVRKELSSQIL